MKYANPKYPRTEVEKAGDHLRLGRATDGDLDVISNWRAAHAFPLLTFRVTLGTRGRKIEQKVLISQRLKRLSSIAAKLNRFRNLRLWNLQDIGGCRAVFSSERRARQSFEQYRDDTTLKHDLLWHKNYVDEPKASGYRSFHLIYGYRGRNPVYDDLLIEIQIRSRFQHAWATAVETVDIFTAQALKSSMGTPEWDEFFKLMSSFIALRERKPTVPGTPPKRAELKSRIRESASHLRVVDRLHDFRQITQDFEKNQIRNITGEPMPGYFLLKVEPQHKRILISAYKGRSLEEAERDYLDVEREILSERTRSDAVLVSVEKLVNLRKAYPNYYGDTDMFLDILTMALEGSD